MKLTGLNQYEHLQAHGKCDILVKEENAMDNSYLILFSFLLQESKRIQLKPLVNSMNLQYPYDILWQELKEIKTDITKTDFLIIVRDILDSDNYIFFNEMPAEVTNVIGYRATKKLSDSSKLSKITDVIKDDKETVKKLEHIQNVLDQSSSFGISKTKLISEMVMDERANDFYVFNYGVCREELVVLCAFTGRGKTSLMLTFVREALLNKLNVMYISIKDFSETMLKQRILSAGEFPDFKASCYSNLTIPDLEIEIDQQSPDIVFVDYLSVMNASAKADTRRFELENITSNLKRIAQDKKIILVTAHQLNKDNPFPKADDLLEAKAGIVSHADLVLGIGGDIHSDYRNITTIKSRRHKPLEEFMVKVNFDNLTYELAMENTDDT